MPTHIYRLDEERTRVASLCPDSWNLPEQIYALERWIMRKKKREAEECIADIGFSVRRGARGGGSALSAKAMRKLGEFGITLFLSEYPASRKKSTVEQQSPNGMDGKKIEGER